MKNSVITSLAVVSSAAFACKSHARTFIAAEHPSQLK